MAIGYKMGGANTSGSTAPKIYVQTSQPSGGKDGEYWVQDSGYSLNAIVVDVVQPVSFAVPTLFVLSAFKQFSYQLLTSKNHNITTSVSFGQVYHNGWKKSGVYIYANGVWNNISVNGNRLYVCNLNYYYEFDINTLTRIKSAPASEHPGAIGGIQNRLYSAGIFGNGYKELDPDTLVVIKTVASRQLSIGGIQNRLYSCGGSSNLYNELDPNTLAVIKTVPSEGEPSSIGGIQNRLYACSRTLNRYYKLDLETLTILQTTGSGTYVEGIGGIQNRLYRCSDLGGQNQFAGELDPDTLTLLSSVRMGVGVNGIGGTK